MDSLRMTVLETYDPKFCCVCTQNGESLYLNIHENVIAYRSALVSLAQIMSETLGINISRNASQLTDICVQCKTKIVEFFIFKRRNEEARKIFKDSELIPGQPEKGMLLDVVDQIDSSFVSPDEEQDDEDDIGNDNLGSSDIEQVYYEPATDASPVFKEDVSLKDPQSIKDEAQGHQDYDEITQDNEMEEEFLDDVKIEITEALDDSTPRRKSNRRCNPEGWIRNKRKLAKNTGQSYVASNGKIVEAKQMKSGCGAGCRFKCSTKVSEAGRLASFEHFYQLADIAKQRKFLFDLTKTYEPKRKAGTKNPDKIRAVQRCYFLEVHHEEGLSERVQVCKLMFLNTFVISPQMIDTLYRKASEGKFNDIRGKFDRSHLKPSNLSSSMNESRLKSEGERAPTGKTKKSTAT